MLLKIVVIAALLGGGLFLVKEERVFERAGIVGYCEVVRAPAGDRSQWHSCHEGIVNGFPRPLQESCTVESRGDGVEYWRCPPR